MIVLNTNGKYEYSSFCTKSNSDAAERWLDKYKDFIVQHRENIIVEFDLERKTANIHLSSIPSERKDINGSPCDTSLTTVGAEINGDDYNIMLSLIMYALSEGFDSLGGIMDTHFKEDFFNVKSQDDIQSSDKEDLVNYKLKDLYEKHTKCVQIETAVELPKVEKDFCVAKSVKTVNVSEFAKTVQDAQNDKDATKFILIITRLSVADEKVKKFAYKEDNKFAKALIFRTSAPEETDWQSYVIKKKSLPLSSKVGIATVAAGILTLALMIWQQPSKTSDKPSNAPAETSDVPAETSSNSCSETINSVFLAPGTYTDGNLKLRVSDTLLQMYNANDSLIQGFIFRCDSIWKVEE